MHILDHIIDTTSKYIEQMPKELRKKYGQFFTSKETAKFMASLFDVSHLHGSVSILDPGAGSGILSIALIEYLQTLPYISNILLVCYENDPQILSLLHDNLVWACKEFSVPVEFDIITENYILDQADAYEKRFNFKQFDLIIANPPYMKISKNAPEALAMPEVCYGAPNLYFLFAAMSLFNLKENGEMVYIIPRSWTSGAYFKKFRLNLFQSGVLESVHLFVSRDKVFEKESVLQETIIIRVKRSRIPPENVIISATNSNADFSNIQRINVPYSTVISGDNHYVYLITCPEEANILRALNQWHNTLLSIGLKMKTGLTVDFRNTDCLRNNSDTNTVPLFYAQHIHNGQIVFPVGKANEYITTDHKALLQKNTNYLFVKRFTTKEEHRRLQCGIYLAKNFPEYCTISTHNMLNFICGDSDLSECAVYGLYVLFNSTLFDIYYRILNGSTQVNSTEINSMPVPTLCIIEEMGKLLMSCNDLSEKACDQILRRYL